MSRSGLRRLGWKGTRIAGLVVLASLAFACSKPVTLPPSVPAAALNGGVFAERDNSEANRLFGEAPRHGKAVQRSPKSKHAPATVHRNRLQLESDEDYVVRIVTPTTSCSGTLISEQLVLTAHHCVAQRDGSGRIISEDLAPKELSVELGPGHFPWAEVSVKAIVSPSCGHSAGAGDVAVLVLTRRLRGVRTLPPALDWEPKLGDQVSHIGFGRCALSEDGIYLKRRARGHIDLISKMGYRVTAPLCPGDSGGPVIDHQSGALTGVVSAGAMDGDESTPDRVEFARLDPFRALFANAERVAEGTPLSELPPVDCPATVEEPPAQKPGRMKRH
jgi:V8-like Glu-specific endopeptidase